MDLNMEKERLLKLININNLYEDDIKIKTDNIDLNISKSINNLYNLTILFDIKMESHEAEQYDKSSSGIVVTYTITDSKWEMFHEGDVSLYFDDGLSELEVKGTETIKYEVNNLKLDAIGQIFIEIEAFLYKKEEDTEENKDIRLTVDKEDINDEFQNSDLQSTIAKLRDNL